MYSIYIVLSRVQKKKKCIVENEYSVMGYGMHTGITAILKKKINNNIQNLGHLEKHRLHCNHSTLSESMHSFLFSTLC